jgi:hypothetical protein
MGDVTVRGSAPAPPTVQAQTPEETEKAKSTAASQAGGQQGAQTASTEASTKKPVVNKQQVAQKKSEQNITGTVKQTQLNQKLETKNTRITEFPAGSTNVELGKINVHQRSDPDQTFTRYPNGVKLKTFTSPVISKHELKPGIYPGGVKLESEGKGIQIDAPPGGQVKVQQDGRIIVSDAKGKEVASMDKKGTLQVHSKHGEYTQSADGKIRFATKEKTNPDALHKRGPIGPGDYEDYGIVSDGKSIEFPNGVKYTPSGGEDIVTKTSVKKGGRDHQISISDDKVYIDSIGNSPVETGYRRDGRGDIVFERNGNHIRVHAPDGDFVIQPGGKVSFEP